MGGSACRPSSACRETFRGIVVECQKKPSHAHPGSLPEPIRLDRALSGGPALMQ